MGQFFDGVPATHRHRNIDPGTALGPGTALAEASRTPAQPSNLPEDSRSLEQDRQGTAGYSEDRSREAERPRVARQWALVGHRLAREKHLLRRQ